VNHLPYDAFNGSLAEQDLVDDVGDRYMMLNMKNAGY